MSLQVRNFLKWGTETICFVCSGALLGIGYTRNGIDIQHGTLIVLAIAGTVRFFLFRDKPRIPAP